MSKAEWVRVGRGYVRLSSIIIVNKHTKTFVLANGDRIECGEEGFNNILELLGLE